MSSVNEPSLNPPSPPGGDTPPAAPPMVSPASRGIVSVNKRGGTSNNMASKVIFAVAVIALVLVGGLLSINRWRANNRAKEDAAAAISKSENKSAEVGRRRTFDTDPPPLPAGGQAASAPTGVAEAGAGTQTCSDGTPGTVLIGPDKRPVMSNGVAMRVCPGGQVIVPAIAGAGAGAPPIPMAGGQPPGAAGQRQVANGQPVPSRYGGDVMVPAPGGIGTGLNNAAGVGGGWPSAGGAAGGNPQSNLSGSLARLQALLAQQQQQGAGGASGGSSLGGLGAAAGGGGAAQAPVAAEAPKSPSGSIGSMLTPSQTPLVQAGMLGDRNMILPKGRTIDCGLSMRLVNEVAGMASCVVSDNVYSDNGRVLLLPRGSEATGEYASAMTQGQKRLFVLWTRVKTPDGVVINLNSPAADGLGTSGMDGYVDNHWWERIGAAFLLSLVQDAIAYETAKAAGPGGTSSTTYQNTASTGNTMAAKVLDSTINIKPTLYKNQGDRGSIYVARDLDFSTVYALRAR